VTKWGVALTTAALIAGACGSSGAKSSPTTTGGGTSATTAASGGGSNTASAPGVTPTTVKIGYITSETGVSSSGFSDGFGAAEARIDVINAAGGINGRKIQLVAEDDQSSPTGDAAAAQLLVSKGVFGVIDYSAFTFGGAPVLQKAGVPVTGYEFDGPEWGEQPYSNMFSFQPTDTTPYGGKLYYYDNSGKFLDEIGGTKQAGFAYGISPSSQASIKVLAAGNAQYGGTSCIQNLSVPFGGVDFTADVLQIKQDGCNAIAGSFVDSSDEAMATALQQAGLQNSVKELYFTGYDSNSLASTAIKSAFNGAYFESTLLYDGSNPAVTKMLANLAQYDPGFKTGELPDFGTWGSYVAADLMVQGLELAGQNPTRASFETNLRNYTSYNAGGILPSIVPFGANGTFGTVAMLPQQVCTNFAELKNGVFVNGDPGGQPVCAGYASFPAS
jgi:branched-chain amino acid transport system substrate-binding protein